jgi:hypothetical protein
MAEGITYHCSNCGADLGEFINHKVECAYCHSINYEECYENQETASLTVILTGIRFN